MSATAAVPQHELRCVIHVHSTFSDGTATVPELVASARRAGADALLLTDHDTLEARRRGLEGWHGSVLLVAGHEVSKRRGHLLAFGLDREVSGAGRTDAQVAEAVLELGGIGFAAHPFSEGSRMSTRVGRPHGWSALEACTGLELWSLTTDAAEAWRSPAEALRFLRAPESFIDGPPARALTTWDRLCATRRMPAIGGLDAHQHGFRVGGRVLSPMANDRYFGLLQTHALLEQPPSGDAAVDAAALLRALAEGSAFMCRDSLAPGDGFRLWGQGANGELAMGAQAPAADGWTLRAELPQPADVRLLRGGEPVAMSAGQSLEYEAANPGSYRVEARLHVDGRDPVWILSNPIYLRGA